MCRAAVSKSACLLMAQAAYQKSRCEKEKERFECGADARQERRLMTQQRALSEIRPMSAAGLEQACRADTMERLMPACSQGFRQSGGF